MLNQDLLNNIVELLEWSEDDDITIEVGGTVVSGITQPAEANPRWSLARGQRRYNRDAFIVIQNNSRRDLTKSTPVLEDALRSESVEGSDS